MAMICSLRQLLRPRRFAADNRLLGILLGQAHIHAVGEFQVPAAMADQHPCRDTGAELARRFENFQVIGDLQVGALADDERQTHEALVPHLVDGRPVLGDDQDFAIHLPTARTACAR